MDLAFVIAYNVPSTGSVLFSFTNANLNTMAYKSTASQSPTSGTTGHYSFSSSAFGTCSVLSATITCNGLSSSIASGTYTLTTLPLLSGTYASVIITTADQNGNTIELSSEYRVNYTTTAVLLTSMSLKFATDYSGSYSANTGSSVIGYLSLISQVIIPSGTTISLYLPITSSTNSELLLGTINTLKANMLQSSTTVNSYSTNLGSLVNLTSPTVSNNLVSFIVPSNTSVSNNIYFYFTNNTQGTLPGLLLPYVSSNTMTKYEAIISFFVSSVEYVYSVPFTILSSTINGVGTLLCTDTSFAGIPLTVSFTPSLAFQTTKGVLYVEIQFSNGYASDLGSGLNTGDSYPVNTTLKGISFNLGLSSVVLSGLTSLNTSLYSFVMPVGAMTGSLSGNIRAYYTSLNVQYEVMKSAILTTGTITSSFFTGSSTAASFVDGAASNPLALSSFELRIQPFLSSGSSNSGTFGVVLPAGFNISSASVYLTSSPTVTAQVLYTFLSPTFAFAFPSIYFSLSSSVSLSTTSPQISITGILASQAASTSYVKFLQANSAGAACTNAGMSTNPSITTSPLSFVFAYFLPTSIQALSPNSLLANVTATLKLPTTIPSSAVIKLNLS